VEVLLMSVDLPTWWWSVFLVGWTFAFLAGVTLCAMLDASKAEPPPAPHRRPPLHVVEPPRAQPTVCRRPVLYDWANDAPPIDERFVPRHPWEEV
jgi:hypothetical protein